MTLGERIYTLRTARNLSQEELAERLDVSRQSVSKWETDVSVPELDKLVKLCDLFGVSLDELVRGNPPAAAVPAPGKSKLQQWLEQKRVIAALVLLALSFVVRMFGPLGIVLGVYILLPCAILTLVLTPKTAFWVCWGALIVGLILCYVLTGNRFWWIFLPGLYVHNSLPNIVVVWVEAILLIAMIVWTVLKIRNRKKA